MTLDEAIAHAREVAKEIYVKAIDDFTKELKDCFIIPHVVKVIEMEAEQLKVVE